MQRLDRPIANGCFGVSLVWISRSRSATAASPPVDRRISPRSAASRRSNSDPGNARAAACSSDSATDSQPASAGPGRGTACSTRCGIARSLPSAAARSSSSSGVALPCDRSSSRSLIAFRSVSRSISCTFLIATAAWLATDVAISRCSASMRRSPA